MFVPRNEDNSSIYNIGIANIANVTGCLGAYTLQIPNQDLKFTVSIILYIF